MEGPNDISFLQNINRTIPEFNEIIDFERTQITIYDLGGSRLINWINKDHFKHSNTKEFHLYDGDIPNYKNMIDKINDDNDGRRFGRVTKWREMENYIPIDLIEKQFNCTLKSHKENWKDFDLPDYLKTFACSIF